MRDKAAVKEIFGQVNRERWTPWGCGKGQPEQVIGTGRGASPSCFRNIRVGSPYAG
jgi:hypothetical protein